MPEASIVRNMSQNRQRLMVYILVEIVTMNTDFLIYQQYQRNLPPSTVGLLRFVAMPEGSEFPIPPDVTARKSSITFQ